MSRRPKQKNDCTVRALAIARRIDYDEAYEILAAAGRQCSKGIVFKDWIELQPWADKIPFPAIKGEKRMNPVEFTRRFPIGTYICKVSKHVFAVVDGVVHDTTQIRSNRCIYTAWKISS